MVKCSSGELQATKEALATAKQEGELLKASSHVPEIEEVSKLRVRLEDALRAHAVREQMFAAERAMLLSRNTAISETVTTLRNALSEKEKRIRLLNEEHEEVMLRATSGADQRLAAEREKVEDLNRVVAIANRQISESSAHNKALREQVERLRSELVTESESKAAAQVSLGAAQQECNILLTKLSEAQLSVKNASAEADAMRTQAEEAMKEASSKATEHGALAASATLAKRSNEERLQNLTNELTRIRSQTTRDAKVSLRSLE
jgi:chromosome segregation ATPase